MESVAVPNTTNTTNRIYRVLDANINRLREALRVIEEYYRFMIDRQDASVTLKTLRHSIERIETGLGQQLLLENRDTETDCFARVTRPEELDRSGITGLLRANFKRAEEASRVIEEFSKIVSGAAEPPLVAKQVRFSLYHLEKNLVANETN